MECRSLESAVNAQLWPLILFPFHISSKPSTLFGIAMRAWARRKTNKALATDKARRAGEIAEQALADALCSLFLLRRSACSFAESARCCQKRFAGRAN